MATMRRRTVYSLEEIMQLLREPVTAEELIWRREALINSNRYIEQMQPIREDVKDWIRLERGEDLSEESSSTGH